MSGYVTILGRCFTCGTPFTFHPHRVPSVPIDPETRRPLDVDANGQSQPIDPAARARAVRQPICSTCIVRINEARIERGQPEIEVFPDAYEAVLESEVALGE